MHAQCNSLLSGRVPTTTAAATTTRPTTHFEMPWPQLLSALGIPLGAQVSNGAQLFPAATNSALVNVNDAGNVIVSELGRLQQMQQHVLFILVETSRVVLFGLWFAAAAAAAAARTSSSRRRRSCCWRCCCCLLLWLLYGRRYGGGRRGAVDGRVVVHGRSVGQSRSCQVSRIPTRLHGAVVCERRCVRTARLKRGARGDSHISKPAGATTVVGRLTHQPCCLLKYL